MTGKKGRWLLVLIMMLTLLTGCGSEATARPATPRPTPPPAQADANTQATVIAVLEATQIAMPGGAGADISFEATPLPTPTFAPAPLVPSLPAGQSLLGQLDQKPTGAKLVAQLTGPTGQDPKTRSPITALALSPDQTRLAIATRYQFWIWEMAANKWQTYYVDGDPEERGAASLAWSADGKRFAAGGFHGLTLLWRWDATEKKLRPGAQRLNPYAQADKYGEAVEVAFSPDNYFLATLGSDSNLTVWTAETGQIAATFPTQYAGFFAWSPDSTMLVDEYLNTHRLNRATSYSVLPSGVTIASERPQGIAWSQDGKMLAVSGDFFNLARLAAPESGEDLHSGVGKLYGVDAPQAGTPGSSLLNTDLKHGKRVAFSPNGAYVAVANTPNPGQVTLWQTQDGLPLTTFEASTSALNGLLWPTSGTLITASDDGNIKFWQLTK